MVEHIEDPLLSGPCKSIKNWDIHRLMFCDAVAPLYAHEISKMMAQTKIAIDDEVNILLLGKGPNKRIATGKNNALRALILGNRKEEKKSEGRITFKVWKMLTPEANTNLRSGEDVKIGIVKDDAMNTGGTGGGKVLQQHKKSRSKFLR